MTRCETPATIGVDVGTSGCKAAMLGADGTIFQSNVATYHTRRRLDGEVTQDARDWLRATATVVRECVLAADGRPIEALSITAPAHAGVLVDGKGEPLTRSLLAFDRRSALVVPPLRDKHGDAFFERTFVELATGWTFPQLVWLRAQIPAVWPRVRWLLTQKDYVRYALTGEASIDPSDAQGTAMYDPVGGNWLVDLTREAGLADATLPPIVPSTAVGGRLVRSWARRTGLPAGLPVVVGATDSAVELVAAGAVRDGDSLVKIASTGTVVCVSVTPRPDRRTLTYPHAIGGLWYHLGATNAAGVSYGWLRETVFVGGADAPAVAYAEMDAVASRVPPGSGGLLYLPFLDGERTPFWDPNLRGAFVGLASAHQREHLARAVLEGVAFSLRSCRDVFTECGLPVEWPQLGGGGIASRLWRSILVSVLDQPARVTQPQGPALGAAMLAAHAIGLRRDRPADRVVRTVRPRQAWVDTYEQVYASYLEAARQLQPISHALSRVAPTGKGR